MFVSSIALFTFFLDIKDFSIEPMFGVVLLTWSSLRDVSIDEFSYEIGIAEFTSDVVCSSVNPTTLPQDYVSYITTHDDIVKVTGLIPDTCYVFGVRVYSLRIAQPGQWTVESTITLSEGNWFVYLIPSFDDIYSF